jgi:hypothetical protein
MGVQTTRSITREHAELKWVEKKADEYREILYLAARALSDVELENGIEETYYNYIISGEADD